MNGINELNKYLPHTAHHFLNSDNNNNKQQQQTNHFYHSNTNLQQTNSNFALKYLLNLLLISYQKQ